MALTRLGGCKTALAIAISSALAGCSSMDQASGPDLKATQTAAVSAPESQPAATDLAAADAPVLEKSGRIHIESLPTTSSALAIQAAALASPEPAPQPIALAIAPVSEATGASQAIAANAAPAGAPQSVPVASGVTLASANPATSPTMGTAVAAKSGRIVQPQLSAGPVANDQVQVAELPITAEMVAIQTVVPTPKPTSPSMMLAYAGPTSAVSGIANSNFFPPPPGAPIPETADASNPQLNKLITRYAGLYGVPEALIHRVVHRESRYDPKAFNKRGYFGLMQIKYSTAKSMGYDGTPEGLLDAETNLKYAIKYLRGAWMVADNKYDDAVRLYARGYYYDAKRKDMLHVLK